MAKKKKVDDQDDFDFGDEAGDDAGEEIAEVEEIVVEEEVVEEVAEDDAIAVEEEVAEVAEEDLVDESAEIAEADEEEIAVVDEDVEEADKDEDDEDKEEEDGTKEEEQRPVAKVTALTLVLCVLNVLAAAGFAFLVLLDYQKRQQWVYGNELQNLTLEGVPLKEQDDRFTISGEVRPPLMINSEKIAAEFKNRKTTVNIPAKDFQDVNEVLRADIKPSELSDGMLKDLFKDVGGSPSRTLEAEVDKVKNELFEKIESAAKKSVEDVNNKIPQEADQRQVLKKVLFPMAHTGAQLQETAAQVDSAPKEKLGELFEDAVQRRMYFELLRVLQMYHHWNLEEPVLEQAVGTKAVKLDQLKDLTAQRLDDVLQKQSRYLNADRTSFEKRDNIGFALVAIANLRVPPTGALLHPREPADDGKTDDTQTQPSRYKSNRTEVVLGLVDYVRATNTLAAILTKLDDLARDKIVADRDGASFESGGTLYHLPGFVSQYQQKVQRLVKLVADIEERQKHVADLKQQLAQTKKLINDRTLDYEAMKVKLLEAKDYTAQLVTALKKLEEQLFNTHKEMAGVMALNAQMEQDIAEAESKLTTSPKKK